MYAIRPQQRVLLGLCLTMLLAATGCEYHYIRTSNHPGGQETYKLTSSHHAAFAPGSTLDIETSSGAITVSGGDVTDCQVSATITGYAPTAEEAQELAEQTVIQLDQVGQTLQVRADLPETRNNRGVGVSYLVTVPRQANLLLRSAYGSVRVNTIEGTVDGKTGNGSIEASAIRGTTRLETSYGTITCIDVVADSITARSSSGSVRATDIEGPTRLESAYGEVTCKRFSGETLTLKSSNGQITISEASFTTCRAQTSYGSVTVSDVRGDTFACESGNGSINISDSEVPRMDLSTSYGRIVARNATTGDLDAVSGNGSVSVACSAACPADLRATARTSYGSVTFTAPPGFAGSVTLASGYGSVNTDLPVAVTGRIGDKRKLNGAIGQGNGSLNLQTSNGSVTLR